VRDWIDDRLEGIVICGVIVVVVLVLVGFIWWVDRHEGSRKESCVAHGGRVVDDGYQLVNNVMVTLWRCDKPR
jgi:hypothetical protein